MNDRQRRAIEQNARAAGIVLRMPRRGRHRAAVEVDSPSRASVRYRHPSGYGRHARWPSADTTPTERNA